MDGSISSDESKRLSAEWIAAGESRPKLPKTQSSAGKILFHENNASCHKSLKAIIKLNELRFQLLSDPPYSPYLAPSDNRLFEEFKACSRERDLTQMKKLLQKLKHILKAKTNRSTKKNKSDNLRNSLKTLSAGKAISAIKLFTLPAKILIIEPVLLQILEKWILKKIPAKYRQRFRKNGFLCTLSFKVRVTCR
ncbi:hypothetical protein TNCV_2258781 [Trichonephila clavipes]|nr:hypothetical protein TNCV_2258781 [Trichonephila clavipes]